MVEIAGAELSLIGIAWIQINGNLMPLPSQLHPAPPPREGKIKVAEIPDSVMFLTLRANRWIYLIPRTCSKVPTREWALMVGPQRPETRCQ